MYDGLANAADSQKRPGGSIYSRNRFLQRRIPGVGCLQCPMNLAPVAVIRFLVSLGRSELKRASDFPIKQDVRHRLQDARFKPEREFTL